MDIVSQMCHHNEYAHRRPPIINQVYIDGCTFTRPVEQPAFFYKTRLFFAMHRLKSEAKN